MKKLLSFTLSIIMVLSIFTVIPAASAKEKKYKSNNCIYTLDKKGNATIVDFYANKGEYPFNWKIPSNLKGHKVTKISLKFNSFSNFNKIMFPKTVNAINKKVAKSIINDYFTENNLYIDMTKLVVYKNSYAHKYVKKHKLLYNISGSKRYYGNLEYLTSSISGDMKVSTYNTVNYGALKCIKTDYTYTGKPIKPKDIQIKNAGKKLLKGKDYTLSYAENIKVGYGIIFVNGKGNYTGTCVLGFRIKPAFDDKFKVSKAGDDSVKIYFSNSGYPCTGRQIQYSSKSDFSNCKKININANEYRYKYVLSGLEKNTVYYVRERLYNQVANFYVTNIKRKFLSDTDYRICCECNNILYGKWTDTKVVVL